MTTARMIDHNTEHAVRRFVARLAGHYDMVQVILFGSRARRTHQPDSDADVAVLLRGPHARLLPVKLAMADLAFDAMLETGIRVQPLPIWEDEWAHPENYSNPALLRNIAREGVRLIADYTGDSIDAVDAGEMVASAEAFVAAMQTKFSPDS